MNNTIKYDVNEQLPDELGDFIQNFKALTQTLYHSNVIIKNQSASDLGSEIGDGFGNSRT